MPSPDHTLRWQWKASRKRLAVSRSFHYHYLQNKHLHHPL